jgi:hypothetical protein
MFKDNEYTTQYYEIINIAHLSGDMYSSRYLAKKNLGYVERHHIIPKSIGGSDDKSNTVWLTAYEHLKCHLLLTEMCENEGHRRKMLLAATRMMNKQDSRREREKLLPLSITEDDIKWLAKIREESAKAHSEYMKVKHNGKNNPFYGKKHSDESNKKRGLWTSENNPMYDSEVVKKMSGDNHYSTKEEHKGKHSGKNNGRYNPIKYTWQNINTGETVISTRLEMIQRDKTLKSNISQVIKGNTSHAKGWRIIT